MCRVVWNADVLQLWSKDQILDCWGLQHLLVLQAAGNANLLRVFGDSFGDVGCLHLLTEVLRRWFCRDSLFCLQPSVNLHSHPLEATGTLVDDTEAWVEVGEADRWWWVAEAVGVANSILELVDLGEFGFQLPLELMQLKLLCSELLIPTCQLSLKLSNSQSENQKRLIPEPN